jgi:hypothetical protein
VGVQVAQRVLRQARHRRARRRYVRALRANTHNNVIFIFHSSIFSGNCLQLGHFLSTPMIHYTHLKIQSSSCNCLN